MTSESSTDLREISNEINELRKELLHSKLLMENLKNEINYSGKILDKNLYLVNLSQKEKSTTYIITFISIILLTFTSIFFFTKLSIENTSSQINLIKDIVLSNYTKSTASTEHSQAERPPKEFPAPIGVSGESLANKILNEFVSNSIELSSKESSESKKEFSLQISAVIDSLLSAGLIAAKEAKSLKDDLQKTGLDITAHAAKALIDRYIKPSENPKAIAPEKTRRELHDSTQINMYCSAVQSSPANAKPSPVVNKPTRPIPPETPKASCS